LTFVETTTSINEISAMNLRLASPIELGIDKALGSVFAPVLRNRVRPGKIESELVWLLVWHLLML